MIGIVRDTWRAVLVVVVAVLLREMFAGQPAAPPVVWQPAQPPTVATPMMMPAGWQQQPEPRRPLRRVGAAFVELAESVIGVVR